MEMDRSEMESRYIMKELTGLADNGLEMWSQGNWRNHG